MARVRDLWHIQVKDETGLVSRQPSARHPRKGGNPKAKRWLAEWTGPSGRSATMAFGKKSDAEAYAVAMEADQNRGVSIDHRGGQVTLREYAEQK